jgi:hypothetical protein
MDGGPVKRLAFAGLLLAAPSARALELHGFLQGHYAGRVSGGEPAPGAGDYLWREERLQFKITEQAASGDTGLAAKLDAVHDGVERRSELEVREAYLSHRAGPLDLRAGRQVLTWGVGDLLFINDVFPKDYTALFTGRPMEYLKAPVSGFQLGLYGHDLSLDLVLLPDFEPDHLPAPDRFLMEDPFAGLTPRTEKNPLRRWKDTETALRLSRPLFGWDAALYAYRGFFRTPAPQPGPAGLTLVYPALSVYGASLQGNALGGVVSLETGYADSRQDRPGADPFVPNSQTKYLAGYQRSPWTDFTVGAQYYGELMARHRRQAAALPAGFPVQDRLRQVLTLRLTQFLSYQTWRMSLFAFYSPTDEDFYAIPEVARRVSDEMTVTAGANVFGGARRTTFFGQLDRNDNLYVTLRYEF